MQSKTIKHRILVVDDSKDWLSTISLILEPDYDLTLEADHSRALKLLKTSSFDLVILDKQLLGISGLEVFERMRAIVPGMRAIMLTGYADVNSAVEFMKGGALDYIDKGDRDLSTTLRSRVSEALERKATETGVMELIAKGESAELEFKASARWDMRANKLNKEIERVVVKTVAAFLNSEHGGTLLLGVDDKGEIIGLRHDYKTLGTKQNRDGYEQLLMKLLLDAYGKDCSPLIDVMFYSFGGEDVCQLSVKPSPKPVFVKDDKGEHLFIRTGNATRFLSTREAIEYCKIRWKQGE